MAMTTKTHAAAELAKMAWDRAKPIKDRIAAAEALQRQLKKLLAELMH